MENLKSIDEIIDMYNFGQISINEIEKTRYNIKNILKYNTL